MWLLRAHLPSAPKSYRSMTLSNLDARLRLQTREEIRRIQRLSGVTTVFVTHDQEEAMSISDVIVVMIVELSNKSMNHKPFMMSRLICLLRNS